MSSVSKINGHEFPTWDISSTNDDFYGLIRNSTKIRVPTRPRQGGPVTVGIAFINHRPSGNFAPHFTIGSLPNAPVRIPFTAESGNNSKCTIRLSFTEESVRTGFLQVETALKEVFAAALVDNNGLPGYEKVRDRILKSCKPGEKPYTMYEVDEKSSNSTSPTLRMRGPAIDMVNKAWMSSMKVDEEGRYDPSIKVQFKIENVNPKEASINQTLITGIDKASIDATLARGGDISNVNATTLDNGVNALLQNTTGKACFSFSRVWFKTKKNGDIETCGIVLTLQHFCVLVQKNTKDKLTEAKCRGAIRNMPFVVGSKRTRTEFSESEETEQYIGPNKTIKIELQDLDAPGSNGGSMGDSIVDAQNIVN